MPAFLTLVFDQASYRDMRVRLCRMLILCMKGQEEYPCGSRC